MIGEKAGISVGAIFGTAIIVVVVVTILLFGHRLAASNFYTLNKHAYLYIHCS